MMEAGLYLTELTVQFEKLQTHRSSMAKLQADIDHWKKELDTSDEGSNEFKELRSQLVISGVNMDLLETELTELLRAVLKRCEKAHFAVMNLSGDA